MTEHTITKPATPEITLNRSNKQIAEHATIQSFLNCYLRESHNYEQFEVGVTGIDTAITEVFTQTRAKEL